MNFLLDENFPKAICPLLEAEGHKIFDYRDISVSKVHRMTKWWRRH